jgi:ribosome-associated toxin RatA of RatAB toxin-antitoxin module
MEAVNKSYFRGKMSMKTFKVSVERVIDASPQQVYNVIADMEEHRRILPKQFESLEVLQGGKGAGTVSRTVMNVMGNRTTLELTIEEPDPGRIIREVDKQAGIATTWTLTPIDDERRCQIRLVTEFPVKPGFAGFMERLLVPPITGSIYRQELENINQYVSTRR